MHERSRGAAGAQEIHDQVERLRVQDGRRLKIFSRGGGSGQNENARADDGADAERRQRPRAQGLTEPVFRVFRVRDQLVDGLATEGWLPEVRVAAALVQWVIVPRATLVLLTAESGMGRTPCPACQRLAYRFA